MGLLEWTRAEVLLFAWRRGRYTPPDRKLLEQEILPALAKEAQRVLFVGVQWYTARYRALFAGKTFATIDPNPKLAEFGSEEHAVDVVENLERHFSGTTFDAVVMNGVIGFGLNDATKVDAALAACAAKMRQGGLLVLGVNEEKPSYVDPSTAPAAALFEPSAFDAFEPKIVVPVPFRERTHTFLFWKKR
jgi:hypothetical protein